MARTQSKRSRTISLEVVALESRQLLSAAPTAKALWERAGRMPAIELQHERLGAVTALQTESLAASAPSARSAVIRNQFDMTNHRQGQRRLQYDVAVRFSYIGAPGNESVGINGFTPPSRATVPAQPGSTAGGLYQNLGGVPYVYAIGQTEVTAGQYVSFLNTVDPNGENPVQPFTEVRLWNENFSPVVNPFSGQINYVQDAAPGTHYRLAASFWRDKPLVNANLFQFAYFANSLYNGTTTAVDNHLGRSPLGFPVRIQTRYVRLSTEIGTGMYDLQDANYPFFERLDTSGYVIPSENEWVKAAYYSPYPTGNGTHYYYYPTVSDSPPTPLQTGGDQPTVDRFGNVIPANLTHGTAYANYDQKVYWRPPYAPESSETMANVVTVGQDRTPSPWLTYDQAGNLVEYTDTIATPVQGVPNPHNLPVFVKAHGGVADASTWQLWLTATGTTDPYGQQPGLTATQGGARFGYLPNERKDRLIPTSKRASASVTATPLESNGLVYTLENSSTHDRVTTSDLARAVQLAGDASYLFLGASIDRTVSRTVRLAASRNR